MGNFNRDNRFGGKPIMHKVICSDCGKECEVPFRPTGQRPVFCNDCFRNHRDANSSRPERAADQYKEQFEILNFKLDKIIKVLTPVIPLKEKKEEKIKKIK